MSDHYVGDTAHNATNDTRSAVGGHYDQANFFAVSNINKTIRGFAKSHHCFDHRDLTSQMIRQ